MKYLKKRICLIIRFVRFSPVYNEIQPHFSMQLNSFYSRPVQAGPTQVR